MTKAAPPVDLRPDHWVIVRDVLRQHIPDRTVLAFGSRATWTAKDYSDLDLAILGDETLPLNITSALAEGFSDSDLPFKVDLVEWTRIDETFRDIIRRDGIDVRTLEAVPVSANPLGDPVTADWRMVAIEEVSEKVAMGPFGSSIKVETFVPEGIPIVNGQHLHGTRVDDSPGYNFISEDHAARLGKANVQRGDIVFTHRGTIGQVAYIPVNSEFERYVISQSQFFVRCDKSIAIPEFVTAYFKSPEGQHKLLANASQVGVPSIAQPVTYLRKVEIPLPPLCEQRAIAHILGTLDDKIDLNRRMNQTLEAMVRAIFKDWFVEFGPVRAKMEGRDTGLPQHIADLFPDRFIDSEIGEIPKGWLSGTIRDVAMVNPESWSPKRPPKEVTYVDLSNTKWGYIEGTCRTPWGGAPTRARRVLRRGDTIIATVRPGNGSFALIDEDGLTGSTGFAVLRPDLPIDRELVWTASTSPQNIDRLAHLADGGAYPAVRPDVVGATSIVLADAKIRQMFSRIAGSLLDKLETNKRASCVMLAIRDALLPKLVSGEIRVMEPHKPMKETAEAAREAIGETP